MPGISIKSLRAFSLLMVAGLTLAVAQQATADDPPAAKDGPTGLLAGKGDVGGGFVLMPISDPAFDKFVDMSRLSRAWVQQDAAAMADAALQLIEAERILFRSHEAVSAQEVLTAAAQLAAEKKDQATLERLARSARSRGDTAFTNFVGNLQKVAATTRDLSQDATFSVADIKSGAADLFQGASSRILMAKLEGDQDKLKALQLKVAGIKGLTPDQKAKLTTQITDALEGIGEPNRSTKMLQMLAMNSRDDVTNSWDNESMYDSPSVPAAPVYTGIVIRNPTNARIKFTVQRGPNAEATHEQLGPGGTWMWWIQGNVVFTVRFDRSFESGVVPATMNLAGNRLNRPDDLATNGRRYRFVTGIQGGKQLMFLRAE